MRISVLIINTCFCIFLLSGCATTREFHVNVDSISDLGNSKNSYVLLPGNKDTKAEDLQFKEYATYVNRALIKQGFVPAESFEKASLAIFLVYGIGEPKESQYSYALPTWGQTGISSSSTTGTVNSYGGYGSYSGTTTYTPTYGVTGSNTYTDSYVTYLRYISLDAVDLEEYKKSKKEVQVWKTSVTSSGSSGDLRFVFPIMIAASKEYIAKNTGKKIKVILHEDDERVIEIKDAANPVKILQ